MGCDMSNDDETREVAELHKVMMGLMQKHYRQPGEPCEACAEKDLQIASLNDQLRKLMSAHGALVERYDEQEAERRGAERMLEVFSDGKIVSEAALYHIQRELMPEAAIDRTEIWAEWEKRGRA